jgi:hypothetical protein
MPRVFFTKDINKLIAEKIGDSYKHAVVVYHEMYDKPVIEAEQILPWQKYRAVYQDVIAKEIVLVGLNRMITPSNRCDFVHEYLTTLTPNIPKIVIDTAPFIGEPWRLFFHYLFSNSNKFGCTYSYPIEGEWVKWFLRESNDCRLSADNLKMFIKDTYCDLGKLETTFSFFEIADEHVGWYEEIRGHIFKKYNTPKTWVSNLIGECNKKFKLKVSFDTYLNGGVISVPDLKVYRFVVEENLRRQDIYNSFCDIL